MRKQWMKRTMAMLLGVLLLFTGAGAALAEEPDESEPTPTPGLSKECISISKW